MSVLRKTLDYTTGYCRGALWGYRMAGRSFWRRLYIHFLVGAILYGTGGTFAYYAADALSRLQTGEPISIRIITKFQAWNFIHRR